jgi:hypothetical protein
LLLRASHPVTHEAAEPHAGWHPAGVRTSAGSMPKRSDFIQNRRKKEMGKIT